MKQITPQEKRRLRLKAAGMCTACAKRKTSNRVLCTVCAERILAKRRKGSHCEVCGVSIPYPNKRCVLHPADEAVTRLKRNSERKAQGICTQCGGEPAINGTLKGKKCLVSNRGSARENYRKLRLKVIALYDGKCMCCGEAEPDFLTLDHVNNDGHRHRNLPSGRAGSALYKYALQHHPDDLQLLCYNCNCAKGHYGSCPHKRLTNSKEFIRPVGQRRIAA